LKERYSVSAIFLGEVHCNVSISAQLYFVIAMFGEDSNAILEEIMNYPAASYEVSTNMQLAFALADYLQRSELRGIRPGRD
jgi:hypothetical protein